jgi:ApbE superfamily uncharacterized protein (UPF0280 family)
MRMQANILPDGRRLHLQDGPIDLIIGADGAPDQIRAAYLAAARRFESVLDELCEELGDLRKAGGSEPAGCIARVMWRAVLPYRDVRFITPMAAVAGAVSEEILSVMTSSAELERTYVNNGGDIAFHLQANAVLRIGMADRPDRPSLFGTAVIGAQDKIRGAATSGWGGRSFSFGIADAVTVLAASASAADAAATIIANDVDLPGHSAIRRRPACELQPDSDLGDRQVTVDVPQLSRAQIGSALARGLETANLLIARGLVSAAALRLQSETRIAGEIDCMGAAANG